MKKKTKNRKSNRRRKNPSIKTPAGDPYAVPDGTPKQLMEFIQNIIRNMPQDEET